MGVGEYSYVAWVNLFHFKMKVILGSSGVYYSFHADWNIRNNSWNISIYDYQDNAIIQGKSMILGSDLLADTYSLLKPNCALVPLSDNASITRITDGNMISGEVKLYHVERA